MSHNLHKSRAPLQSPKPPPVKLNLEGGFTSGFTSGSAFSPVRSPALKKAIVETGSGRKRQITTLRNLRTDFNQIQEEADTHHQPTQPQPTQQPMPTQPNPAPLPPPVMSAVLVSPKEKKTASTTPSPSDGKQFHNLARTNQNRDKQIANQNQDNFKSDNQNSEIYLEIETEQTHTTISHADQETRYNDS